MFVRVDEFTKDGNAMNDDSAASKSHSVVYLIRLVERVIME